MATIGKIRKIGAEVTIQLYRATAENNQQSPDDLTVLLEEHGINGQLRERNPATHEMWSMVIDLTQDKGVQGAVVASLHSLLRVWLKAKMGRTVEIERDGLKVKAATAKDLERSLATLRKYDEASLTVNNTKPAKKPVRKVKRTSRK